MAERYVSALTGPEMDEALLDMAQHNSEAWAIGERHGVAVDSSDDTYHNNSKYYATEAEAAAARAEAAVPAGTEGAVLFSQAQSLTAAQKQQAFDNIAPDSVNQLLDIAKYDSGSVVGIHLPRFEIVSGDYPNRRNITTAGWYRIATISTGTATFLRIVMNGYYNSQVPTTFDLEVFCGRNYSANVVAEWKPVIVKAAGRSISKIRIGSNGNALTSLPQFVDIYIPRAMTASSGQGYQYTLIGVGVGGMTLTEPTLVEATPAQTSEYTLVDTTA